MTHPTFRRAALAAAAALACAALAPAQAQTTTTTTTTTTVMRTTTKTTTKTPAKGVLGSGVDRAGMDTSVRPQDDLFLATNGTWVKNTEIPADKSAWGAFYELRDRTDHQVRGLIEGMQATNPAPGATRRRSTTTTAPSSTRPRSTRPAWSRSRRRLRTSTASRTPACSSA